MGLLVVGLILTFVCVLLASSFQAFCRAEVIVEVKGIEPRFDIFASLHEVPDAFGKAGETFCIAVRSPRFHKGLGLETAPLKGVRARGLSNCLYGSAFSTD